MIKGVSGGFKDQDNLKNGEKSHVVNEYRWGECLGGWRKLKGQARMLF